MNEWSPIANAYDPLKAGSIDGTDVEPHDRAVWRAMFARYKPNKGVAGDPLLTLFVARLNPQTTEDRLHEVFSKYGAINRLRLVRDIVTGTSKRYAFVEYKEERSIVRARREANKLVVEQHELFVDFEQERTLKGWIPRRLGGGQGGKKESGQLRFGGKDRPFRKPINLGVNPMHEWAGGAREWAGGAREWAGGAREREERPREREERPRERERAPSARHHEREPEWGSRGRGDRDRAREKYRSADRESDDRRHHERESDDRRHHDRESDDRRHHDKYRHKDRR